MANTQRPHSDPELTPTPTDEGMVHVGPAAEQSDSNRQAYQELLDQLARLSDKVVEVVQTAWNTPERQRVQENLRKQVDTIEENIKRMGENPTTQDFQAQTKDVMDDINKRVQQSDGLRDVTANIATGLRTLGDKLDEWSDELAKRQDEQSTADATQSTQSQNTPAAQFPPDESQDIPVEKG